MLKTLETISLKPISTGHTAAIHRMRWDRTTGSLIIIDGEGSSSLLRTGQISWSCELRGRTPLAMENTWIHDAAFSFEGDLVVLAFDDGITALEVPSGEVAWSIEKGRWTGMSFSAFMCVCALPDGTFMTGTADGEVMVIDRAGTILRHTQNGRGPTLMARTSGGLVMGSDGFGIMEWDPATLRSRMVLPDERIFSLSTLEGALVYRSHGKIGLFQPRDERHEVRSIQPGPPSLAFSPARGGLAFTVEGDRAMAYDTHLDQAFCLAAEGEVVVSVAANIQGELAVGFRSGQVALVNLNSVLV